MSTTRLYYARALLVQGGYQRGYHYEKALVAIMTGEGSTAAWNPMDTTLNEAGATPYNSFGPGGDYHVWNYVNADSGVNATLKTMAQSNMAAFANALKEPCVDAIDICTAFSQVPWAFIGDRLPLHLCEAWNETPSGLAAAEAALVHGTGPWPFKPDGTRHG